jgi:hypothetical protein
VAQLVEALRYKPERRGFDSSMVSLEFFIDIILSLVFSFVDGCDSTVLIYSDNKDNTLKCIT